MSKGLKPYLVGGGYRNTSTSSFQRFIESEGFDASTLTRTTYAHGQLPVLNDGNLIKQIAYVGSAKTATHNLRAYHNGAIVDTLAITASTTGLFESEFTEAISSGDDIGQEWDYNAGSGTLLVAFSLAYEVTSR